jgi:HEAT repeat protein
MTPTHLPEWSLVIAFVSLLLGCQGSDRHVAYKELLSDDPQARADAAHRLGQARAVDAVGSLVAVLDDPDETVRVTAIRALGQIGDRRALPALVGRADDPLASVRLALCQALGQLADPAAVPTLARLLHDPDETIRLGAARALGKVEGGEGTRTLLAAALRDRSEAVRRHATRVLGERRSPEVLPELTAALDDPDPTVRANAARVLSGVGDRSAVPALLRALGDPAPTVRSLASHALGRIAPEDMGVLSGLRHQFERESDPLCEVDLALNLARGGDRRGLPRIRELLLAPSGEAVQAEAAMALGEVGEKNDIALLHRVLDGGTGLVRKQASLAVQKLEKT